MASNCDLRLAAEALEENGGGGGDGFRPYGNKFIDPQALSAAHKAKISATMSGRRAKKGAGERQAIRQGMAKCESGGSADEATNILREKYARLLADIRALTARVNNSVPGSSGRIVWEGQLERARAKAAPMAAAIEELESGKKRRDARPSDRPAPPVPPTTRQDTPLTPAERAAADRVRQQREDRIRRDAELAARQERLNQSPPTNPIEDIGNWRLTF